MHTGALTGGIGHFQVSRTVGFGKFGRAFIDGIVDEKLCIVRFEGCPAFVFVGSCRSHNFALVCAVFHAGHSGINADVKNHGLDLFAAFGIF